MGPEVASGMLWYLMVIQDMGKVSGMHDDTKIKGNHFTRCGNKSTCYLPQDTGRKEAAFPELIQYLDGHSLGLVMCGGRDGHYRVKKYQFGKG